MKTFHTTVKLRDGEMGAYLAIPDKTPAGAIIAIMEIWGVNDTMRHHAHEFAEAGFICLVPDLFWRQEPGVELSDKNPEHVTKAFDLYYDFDYDLAVRDMEDSERCFEDSAPTMQETSMTRGFLGSRAYQDRAPSKHLVSTGCPPWPTSFNYARRARYRLPSRGRWRRPGTCA
jgi:carboxymethylenebutenolidase